MAKLLDYFPISLIIIGFLMAFQPYSDPGNEIQEMLKEASERVESADEPRAMELYREVLEKSPDQMEALWNISVLYSQRGYRADDSSDQESDYESAQEYAEQCLDTHPNKAPCHFAKALAIGRMSEISGTRDRIRKSDVIKNHAERAVDIDPDFSKAWHLLGVWHSEVANLGRRERFAARTFFGRLPPASNEEAETALTKALELRPQNVLIHLDYARHYHRIGENEKAIDILEKVQDLDNKYAGDPEHKAEAQELLDNLT